MWRAICWVQYSAGFISALGFMIFYEVLRLR
jgi:hypothetical protein